MPSRAAHTSRCGRSSRAPCTFKTPSTSRHCFSDTSPPRLNQRSFWSSRRDEERCARLGVHDDRLASIERLFLKLVVVRHEDVRLLHRLEMNDVEGRPRLHRLEHGFFLHEEIGFQPIRERAGLRGAQPRPDRRRPWSAARRESSSRPTRRPCDAHRAARAPEPGAERHGWAPAGRQSSPRDRGPRVQHSPGDFGPEADLGQPHEGFALRQLRLS
jgi:hypothetical protein